jgi:hypothetical protein
MSTSVTRLLREKLHDGLSHPFGSNIPMSHLLEVMISFVFFRTFLPFSKSRDEISFKRGGL